MAIISSYPKDSNISLMDKLIGTDAENSLATKNFEVADLRTLILAGLSPEIGGTLKITEVRDDSEYYLTPAEVLNNLSPVLNVLQYDVVIVSMLGNRYLLKIQDVAVGIGETPVTDADFIVLNKKNSVGDGTSTYKGFNTTSQSDEFRSVKSTGIDVSTDGNNILIEKKAGTNLGTGTAIYKGLNATTKVDEFYKVKSTGLEVSISTDDLVIESKEGTNLGNGTNIYKGLNAITKLNEFYNLKSTTLNISKEVVSLVETGNVLINIPITASIPGLYVNNLYKPTYQDWVSGGGNLVSNPSFLYKGEGTLSKPFTDSRNYTTTTAFTDTANTAIQNALDVYVGAIPLVPAKLGQQIIVQNNTTGYTFAGDFNYSGLNIKLEGNILSTNTDYIVDMDNAVKFNNLGDTCTFTLDENINLTIQGKGFKNNGNTVATNNFSTYRQVRLFGNGVIASSGTDITKYILSSDVDSVGNGAVGFNNDGFWQFEVRCSILSNFQGIYKIGGKGRIYSFGASYQSGNTSTNVNTSLKAFYQGGGQIRFFENTLIQIYGNLSTVRDVAFQFEPTNGFTPDFVANGTNTIGGTNVLFNKSNNNNVSFSFIGSISPIMGTTSIFDSTNLWQVDFKNNIFSSGEIDTTVADLTKGNLVSCTNTIGSNLVESLVYFTSKQSAKSSSFPINSAFLVKRDVNAGSLIIGTEYKIKTAGTGTPLGTVGDYFIAANNGSAAIGGVATLIERCVMI